MAAEKEKSRVASAHPGFDWIPRSSRVVTGLEVICALLLFLGGVTILSGIWGLATTPQDRTAVVAVLFGLSLIISGILVYSLSIMIRILFTMDTHLQYLENLAAIVVERLDGIQR